MVKLKQLIGALASLLATAPAERDEKGIVKCLKDIEGEVDVLAKDNDNAAFRELAAEVKQVRKDVDALAERQRNATPAIFAASAGDGVSIGRPQFRFSSPELALRMGRLALDVRAIRSGEQPKHFAVKDITPSSDPAGGYLIPDAVLSAEILRGVERVGVMASEARLVPLGAGGFKALRGLAGITVAWKTPGAEGAEGSPTFGALELNPETLMGLVDVDIEADEDSIINLGNYLASEAVYGLAKEEDRVMIAGTGAAGDGGITGILASDRVTVVTMDSTKDAFTDVDEDACMDLEAACNEDAANEDGVYLLHRTILNVLKKERSSTGERIDNWMPGGGGEGPTINGYRYRTSGRMPGTASSAPSTKFMAFGNFRRGVYLGRRGGVRIDFSDHVRFRNGQRVWRFMERLDAAINGYTAAEIAANPDLSNPIVVCKTAAN